MDAQAAFFETVFSEPPLAGLVLSHPQQQSAGHLSIWRLMLYVVWPDQQAVCISRTQNYVYDKIHKLDS